MNADEKFVREHWIDVYTRGDGIFAGAYKLQNNHGGAWSAAAEFTRKRMAEIAEVMREIDFLNNVIRTMGDTGYSAWRPEQDRILSREQAALADLERGMVPQRRAATEKEK